MIEAKEYQWDDGYVFLRSRHSWKRVCELWHEGDVRYAGRCTSGPDAIVVFVAVAKTDKDRREKLNRKMKRVEDAANPTFSSATSTKVGTNGPTRWSVKKPLGAHLRYRTRDAEGVFEALFPGAGYVTRQNYYGHAKCDGQFQVLLELGADTPEELSGAIAGAMRVPDGGDVAVTTLTNAITEPKGPPAVCEEWAD